jgi:hypothetical protein
MTMIMMMMMPGGFKAFFSKCGLFTEFQFRVQEHNVLIILDLGWNQKKIFTKYEILLHLAF